MYFFDPVSGTYLKKELSVIPRQNIAIAGNIIIDLKEHHRNEIANIHLIAVNDGFSDTDIPFVVWFDGNRMGGHEFGDINNSLSAIHGIVITIGSTRINNIGI